MSTTGTVHNASWPREKPRSSSGFKSAGINGSVSAAIMAATTPMVHQRRDSPNQVMSRERRRIKGARTGASKGAEDMAADSTGVNC